MPASTRDRAAGGLARAACVLPCIPLAAAGALVEGLPVLAWGAASAAAGALLLAWAQRACGDVLPELPRPATGATALGVAPAVLAGALALETAGGLLVVLLLVAGTAVLSRWLATEEAVAAAGRGRLPAGDAVLRRVLATAPVDRLLDEWHRAQERLDGGARAGLAEVRLRDALIDEFTARDPDGTRRWLDEDPTGPPDPWLGRDASRGH